MWKAAILLGVGTALAGCNSSGKAALGGDGSEETSGEYLKDARLITDVFTWECIDPTSGKEYFGAYAHHVSLEYAPDALRALDLPSPGGCAYGLDMFPSSAGAGGKALSGTTGEPEWATDSYDGEFKTVGVGFWFDDVLGDAHICGNEGAEERLEGGTTLGDAGALTGISTPLPADIPELSYSGFETVVSWGDEVTVEIEDHDWEQVWVQLRRENSLGEAIESVTCNITGQDEFVLDAAIWSMLNEELELNRNNLYVAFQRGETVEAADGSLVDVFTRVIDVAVILD